MLGLLILVTAISAIEPGEIVGPPNLSVSKTSDPAKLAAYEGRRSIIPDTADAHWKLGLWCEQNGLKPEAIVEFLSVTRLDPRRDAAWKKLGYEKKHGRWTTPEIIAAERAELDAQRKADAKWRPLLQKWKNLLALKSKRSEAETALATVTDPRAVPSILRTFGGGTAADQERAIDMLGRIEGVESSYALANLAISGKTEGVRRAAVETLARIGANDVFMAWIGELRTPITYEIRRGPDAGSHGVLYIEGAQQKFRRKYEPPTGQVNDVTNPNYSPQNNRIVLPLQFDSTPTSSGPPPGSRAVGQLGDVALYVYTWQWAPPTPPPPPKNASGPTAAYQVYERAVLQARINRDYEIDRIEKNDAAAEDQLEQDVHTIEAENGEIREVNQRLLAAMERISGKTFGTDREAWLKWWIERKGYKYIPQDQQPKEIVDVHVPVGVPSALPPILVQGGGGGGGGGYCMVFQQLKGQRPTTGLCFAAGTPVQTVDGLRPIETLRAGDRVLTTDRLGAEVRPAEVASIHRSQASGVLRLTAGGETITTTDGHPFWNLDTGWVRADCLKAGDTLKTRAGTAIVEATEHDGGAEVWNFDVKDGSNFLVGRGGLLVHDFGPDPENPGDEAR